METREKILAKASEMLLSLGIRNVTMDLLSESLGMSKRTIYEHFRNKEELVIESIHFIIVENNKELLEIIESSENVVEAIYLITLRQEQYRREFPKVFVEDIKKYFPLVQASFFSNKDRLKQFSASYTLLEKGLKEEIFCKDLRINLVDNFIHEIISMIHTSDRIRLLKPSDREVACSIFIPYLKGICTAKGLKLMDKYFDELSDYN
ncbi:MAG TPA: TetR/AcrR family transcriptional regulator [Bacteroidales bacterium]|nr:TetR/AcrR family transcriptional regulator [Bacteroidales bacterium]